MKRARQAAFALRTMGEAVPVVITIEMAFTLR
jgi:hypothetical protein